MTSIRQRDQLLELRVDQLLDCAWIYAGSNVLESAPLEQGFHHRVLTKWQNECGEELCFLLNFVSDEQSSGQIVTPSTHCRPRIDRRARLLDRYGFEVTRASRRSLEWDLLMQLDLDSVSQDLTRRLVTH